MIISSIRPPIENQPKNTQKKSKSSILFLKKMQPVSKVQQLAC
jgi:hypothetical protein